MNRQKKILKANECASCKEQMTTINIQNGWKLCNACFEIIRVDTPEEIQRLKDRNPKEYAFKIHDEKAKQVFDRIMDRYVKTGHRYVFDRDVLDSESGEIMFKEFVRRVFSMLDYKLLMG